ncbi:MAG: RNA polymerase sigma factor SigX [Bacillota bacterium]|uniref:RNA polymerase sigma factor n=1 Tax=Virgibacillus salarius TaxID=447199 RepID=A0A941DWL3_9BACI|nr:MULTISPECIES: RNA polymerase sigma factor SigX [Bacillaceae]NAZ08236.1 RNA polymerase sigma factor SigX [Agaribacter marinus]MBR7795523.1 RNA polymerase sigma factor SigX [Virgibacillus salarius]MCC2249051.1 RNA polymerase sigma factor SigX [Virgibacillus sp. AGTR]MDY7043411.1 RNA polymerase sigma factor SigX [Virgibacillus sp. M23]QRZ16985.1 RNA polymerase sigma factor SigX [Virgibacillus sp. AGTR]
MEIVFEELYEKYHKDLYQFVFYMVKDRLTTEDLVQEVYIKVLKSHHHFKGDSSVRTWLFSIARHVTIDYFRSQNRKRKRILTFFDWTTKGEKIEDVHPLPDEVAIQSEELKQIYNCLDQCTIDQKSVIILRYMQSFSIKETAEILNFSESKVKTTQHRALKALRTYIENQDEGGERR